MCSTVTSPPEEFDFIDDSGPSVDMDDKENEGTYFQSQPASSAGRKQGRGPYSLTRGMEAAKATVQLAHSKGYVCKCILLCGRTIRSRLHPLRRVGSLMEGLLTAFHAMLTSGESMNAHEMCEMFIDTVQDKVSANSSGAPRAPSVPGRRATKRCVCAVLHA